jgi:hypothetical protein
MQALFLKMEALFLKMQALFLKMQPLLLKMVTFLCRGLVTSFPEPGVHIKPRWPPFRQKQ